MTVGTENCPRYFLIVPQDCLILVKVNITFWIGTNEQLHRNSVQCSDSRTKSKCKSPNGCRTIATALLNSLKANCVSKTVFRLLTIGSALKKSQKILEKSELSLENSRGPKHNHKNAGNIIQISF